MKQQTHPQLKHPELSNIRGMSEPHGFSFNVLDKGRTVLVHAVVFTSYETAADSDRSLAFPDPEKEPRMRAFVDYCIHNYGQKAKEQLEKAVDDLAHQIDERKRALNQLDHQIKKLKREVSK